MKTKLLSLLSLAFCLTVKAQILTIVAGNGTSGYSGDGGPAIAAELNDSWRIQINDSGNLIIADNMNNRVRKVDSNGIITTIAGGNIGGTFSGDGGPATAASLNIPEAYEQDYAGNAYVADWENQIIRKINSNGIISTCAGSVANASFGGDGGPATSAYLNHPWEMVFDHAGNYYIADWGNNRIRIVNSNGIINTYAGNGAGAYSGDGNLAINASLFEPSDVLLDAIGNLYIVDSNNHAIRKVSATGIITTIAGNGTAGYSGDGGLASNAQLNSPFGFDFDSHGNLYIADEGNAAIRKIDTNGIITTILNLSDGLSTPYDIAIDNFDNIYIDDPGKNVVYKANLNTLSIKAVNMPNAAFSIYPNPAGSRLNIKDLMQNEVEINIIDVLGNVLLSTKEKEIDISNLRSGVYFVRIGNSVQKFVKE